MYENVLIEHEWAMLEQFLFNRQLEMNDTNNKEICKNALNAVRRKDARC